MQIIFSDLFKQECELKLGISTDEIQQAINNPDSQQIIKYDELEIILFVKQEYRHNNTIYLLICTRKINDDDLIVDLSFRLLPELVHEANTLEPIILLQQLASRFGMMIRIGYQYNKFIFREIIPIEDKINELSRIVEIVDTQNHPSFTQSIFLRIEEQNNKKIAHCALAYCINTDEYIAWLFGRTSNQEVIIDIAPQIRSIVTPYDLIEENLKLSFKSNYSQIGGNKTGFLFRIITNEYYLELGFRQNYFYIIRNEDKLEKLIEPLFNPSGNLICYANWEPNQISLSILDESYDVPIAALSDPNEEYKELEKIAVTLKTKPTFPPNSLINWIRQEVIEKRKTYSSLQDFSGVVVSAIKSIQDKVDSIGLTNPFWNIVYDGSRITHREPKREPDIQPTIHSLLFDISIAKNFQIIPEYPIAGGRLDFLISSVLSNHETTYVCIEFKHGHSKDLLHGLLKQLPEYMRAKGCNFGIYCVMYFKGKHFSQPSQYDLSALELFLDQERIKAGLLNIKILLLDFSYKNSPSNL